MRSLALLDLAGELLRAVLRFEQPSDTVVSSFFRQHRNLGPRERHALAETVYSVLRRRPLLQHLAQSGPGPLERRLALLGSRGGEGLSSGVLSPSEAQWLEHARAVAVESLPDEFRHNLPVWLAQALRSDLGDEQFWALAGSLDTAAPLDLRVNALRAKRDEARASLAAAGIETQPTPYSPWGLRVCGKPALGKLGVFTRGDVEVQDEGSQLLALLSEARRGEMVVDFCAGAGGKTLALGAMMRNTGRLYAFDVSGHRLEALKPRLERSGLSNVYAVQIAHERDGRIERLAGKIDRVLVDAPCSGLGTLRRNPDLKWRQSQQTIDALSAAQSAILSSAARLLKPGGRLVYATCSLLPQENEEIARGFSSGHPDFVLQPAIPVLERAGVQQAADLAQGDYLRLWPHRHATDGFFAAVWQRK